MVTKIAPEESAICIWCNKPIEPGQNVEVIHVTEPNALGISRNNCFEQLKSELHKGERTEEEEVQAYPEGYVPVTEADYPQTPDYQQDSGY